MFQHIANNNVDVELPIDQTLFLILGFWDYSY